MTNGDPCPCMPRVTKHGDGFVVSHNSYDAREVGVAVIRLIDAMGSALADHNHKWSAEMREQFDTAIHLVTLHWPNAIH